ncbi:MAG: hypothetical protein GX282_04445 [Campylobacteraceae bacterium]|nr:hypothetical protein [Campylobacteraceae bacterium]
MLKEPFVWDSYSDQPHVIKDKNFKKNAREKHAFDYLKMLLSSLFILPLAFVLMRFFRGNLKVKNSEFYGIGVNLDKDDGKNTQQNLVQELGVKNLLIRVPLWDTRNLDKYVEFAKSFGDKNIMINIMQDRENIENHELLKTNLEQIFTKFDGICSEFQVGSTINRLKWGFFAPAEYLEFYKVAQDLRDEKFPHFKLIGPSVIDFEYHYNVSTMFNFQKIKFDKISALLYVDRRGDPANYQYRFFNLKSKIDLLFALTKLSPKCANEIYITETNYPLANTAPYAPTSEKECVTIEKYTEFMVKYHQIAKKSGKIKKVYWHQLIAPGYGLVDNRDGKIVKMPQFYAYKKMINEDFS